MTKGDKLAKLYHEHEPLEAQYRRERGLPDIDYAQIWTKPGALIPVSDLNAMKLIYSNIPEKHTTIYGVK